MNFLLDTDTCVYWLRGHPAMQRRLATIAPDELAISIISLAELSYGAYWSAQAAANMRAIDAFAGAISVLNLDAAIVQSFGEVKALLRRQGQLLEDFDLLIAMTARVHGLSLVTNNEQHFQRIPGMQLVNWLRD